MGRIISNSRIILPLIILPPLFAADYDQLKSDAEKFYADGSYGKANELYSQAGTQTPDPSQFEKAQQQLNVLIRDIQRVEDQNRGQIEPDEPRLRKLVCLAKAAGTRSPQTIRIGNATIQTSN